MKPRARRARRILRERRRPRPFAVGGFVTHDPTAALLPDGEPILCIVQFNDDGAVRVDTGRLEESWPV